MEGKRILKVVGILTILAGGMFYLSSGRSFTLPRINLTKDPLVLEEKTSQTKNSTLVYMPFTLKKQTTNGTFTPSSPWRWAVISIAVTPKMSKGYIFCLPLTVAAWKRIGWHTMIIITGEIEQWKNSSILNIVKQTTLDIDNTARFIMMPVTHNPVSYAQVSRSFVVAFADWLNPDDIVMTSDIDIVPLKGEFYDKVRGNEIFILNADCCGSFRWKDKTVRMQPMTSIGMSAQNWIQVMNLTPLPENQPYFVYVNSWLLKYYGRNVTTKNVAKGVNENWYLDQRVVSIQLHMTNIKQNKLRRQTFRDRVDRAFSGSWTNFKSHVDAHVYLDPLTGNHWDKTLSLITDVFPGDVADKLKQFKDDFVKAFDAHGMT
ncbi:uncharacterized protein LOC132749050 [Ruditapes philippinarum]|uniref:uncharacterized protein LOC132749050 n=1 Tax=Ruditapes philippinarum TaxID=129788 RepID=UPI00295AE202|nr:uncharacterized protein LOC132749050 [Ruditapes philippinarum]